MGVGWGGDPGSETSVGVGWPGFINVRGGDGGGGGGGGGGGCRALTGLWWPG